MAMFCLPEALGDGTYRAATATPLSGDRAKLYPRGDETSRFCLDTALRQKIGTERQTNPFVH